MANSTPSITFSGATFSSPTTATLTGYVSDDASVTSVEIYNGTTDLGPAAISSGNSFSYTGTLSPGLYVSLQAISTDVTNQTATGIASFVLAAGIVGRPYASEVDFYNPNYSDVGDPSFLDSSTYFNSVGSVYLEYFLNLPIGSRGSQVHVYELYASNVSFGGDGYIDGYIYADGSNDTIYGGSASNDIFDGSGKNNVLVAGSGTYLVGGSGQDTLIGGGHSRLVAGSGTTVETAGFIGNAKDTLVGGAGNDVLAVVEGNNLLIAGSGASTLFGGLGQDTLFGGGKSPLVAGSGAGTLTGGFNINAQDSLYGGAGNDLLAVVEGNNQLVAGSGNNTLFAGSGQDTLVGGGQSQLVAGSGPGTLIGGFSATAHDTLYGGTGTDVLAVVEGNNKLIAGTGSNVLFGGSGQDTLVGGGQSLLIGGTGPGTLIGGFSTNADDTLRAGTGNSETLAVVSGNNQLFADSMSLGVSDVLYAGTGNDTLYGAGYANSAATGPIGLTAFVVGQGNSTVLGGTGNDYVAVVNGTGSSSIDGGGGVNTVQFTGHSAADATIATMTSGVTMITFADSAQTATLTHVTGLLFQGDTVVRSLS